MLSSEHIALKRLRHELARRIAQDGYLADANGMDLTDVTAMDHLFSVGQGDLGGIDLPSFRGDISQWDVSRVTSMKGMFQGSWFKGDISAWDVSHVVDATNMFRDARCEVDLSSWQTGMLVHASGMFCNAKIAGLDLSQWDVSLLQDASGIFERASCTGGDLSLWDVGHLRDATNMFEGTDFHGDVARWRPRALELAAGMFAGTLFDGDVSGWRVPCLHEATGMFVGTPFARVGLLDAGRTLHLAPSAPAALLMGLGLDAAQARQWLCATKHEGLAAFELVELSSIPGWLPREAWACYQNAKLVLPSFGVAEHSLARLAWEYWTHARRSREIASERPFDWAGVLE